MKCRLSVIPFTGLLILVFFRKILFAHTIRGVMQNEATGENLFETANGGCNQTTFDVSNFMEGVYIIRLETDKGSINKKITVN